MMSRLGQQFGLDSADNPSRKNKQGFRIERMICRQKKQPTRVLQIPIHHESVN